MVNVSGKLFQIGAKITTYLINSVVFVQYFQIIHEAQLIFLEIKGNPLLEDA